MAIAGRVAIVPKGNWSANATYKRLDAVTYNNTLYFAKKEVPAGTATSNTEYWSKSIVGGVGAIATKENAGVVKPADGLSIAEDGTLKVSIDGTTLTMDQVNNVIKLADTLKEKINGAFPAANLINNLTTTEAGFGLDARQGKALDDKITEINGSLNQIVVDVSDKLDTNLVSGSCAYVKYGKIVIVYSSLTPKATCDNKLILPSGTLPLPYQYMYHSVNGWGINVANSLFAVNADGSMSFWCIEENLNYMIFDSFVYMAN